MLILYFKCSLIWILFKNPKITWSYQTLTRLEFNSIKVNLMREKLTDKLTDLVEWIWKKKICIQMSLNGMGNAI